VYPFTLFIFHEGREFQMEGEMPSWLQSSLNQGNWLCWYGFLKGMVENVEELARQHPKEEA
jgi:hypothetical protein